MEEFDELSLRNQFENDIKEIFNSAYNSLGTEVEVISFDEQHSTFPCCLVSIINPISAERHIDNTNIFNYIDFTLNCELYSKELNNFNQNDAIIKLSQILINGIVKKYPNLIVTRNTFAPYRDDTYRKVVSFRGTLDNKTKQIYSK